VAPNTIDTQVMQLPLQVASPVDVGRLLRELEAIDDLLTQAGLRGDDAHVKLPKTTGLLDQTILLNKVNLAEAADRQKLTTFLKAIKAKAPLLHISFSADPSTAFIDKLLTWLRKELHPNVLLTIGLQPNIGAGCIVRSMNKYFDFSLRQDFAGKRAMLLEKLGPILAAPQAPGDSTTVGTVTQAVQTTEASRAAAPAAQAVHAAPQPTAKFMTPATATQTAPVPAQQAAVS
jgi:hypothetical protein